MDQHFPVRVPSSRIWRPASGLLRRIYVGNPFYILSADLVFVGLRMSFDPYGETFEVGALWGALLGYTLLLATTAFLLIRIGRVWDDARTILLLVVAMFLAVSMTFDETLAMNPRLGAACYAGGLAFAVAVSEGLLWGIRLRLPAFYRIPYYLILSLFFLYPIALTPLLGDPDGPALPWALFGFSPLAGAAFLALIPAIRRGANYVCKNGSPWRYPLYPWSLFGLLAAAVCARAFCLCLSLHFPSRSVHFAGRSDSIFGPYFLVPFLLALDLLLLEAGLISRSRKIQKAAILVLPAVALLAMAGHQPDPVYRGFLNLFMETTGGSPLFLALIAIAGFTAYAAIRGAALAFGGLSATLATLTVVGPGTIGIGEIVPPQSAPLLTLGLLQLWLGIKERTSWRCAFGVLGMAAAAMVAPVASGAETARAFATLHLGLLAMAIVGACFDDPFTRQLRRLTAIALAWTFLAAEAHAREGLPFLSVPPGMVPAYALFMVAACAGWGLLTGSRAYLVAAVIGLSTQMTSRGFRAYGELRRHFAGLDLILLGLSCFVIAALISFGKTIAAREWGAAPGNDGADESLDVG